MLGANLLKIRASGTMPHALVQILEDQEKAWRMFDRTISRKIPRIALVDTFWDEKTESVKALELLGSRLWGVRIDTPASRRGNFRSIIEEVRWELNIRGGKNVKLIASGRLDEASVEELRDIVDGFGIGTGVAYPPVIDLSAKIVEVYQKGKRQFRAKRGGLGGRKDVYRSKNGYQDRVLLHQTAAPAGMVPLLKPLIKGGKIVRKYEGIELIRARALRELRKASQQDPMLSWGEA